MLMIVTAYTRNMSGVHFWH